MAALEKRLTDLKSAVLDWHNVQEGSRTYHYAGGETMEFKEVTRVCVRPSGNHRLEMKNGDKAIVAAGWRAITFKDSPKWEF